MLKVPLKERKTKLASQPASQPAILILQAKLRHKVYFLS